VTMAVALKSALIGCGLTVLLVGIAVLPLPENFVQRSALWLLGPGILLGFIIGSRHVHDLSFWLFTALLNAAFYIALTYFLLRIKGIFRSRTAGN
jgi:hypothetical protein